MAVEEENRRRNTLASTCPNTSANQKNYSHAHSRGGRDSNVDIANATIYPTNIQLMRIPPSSIIGRSKALTICMLLPHASRMVEKFRTKV